MPRIDTTLTMAALLDKLLAYRSPIVIGYSGWDSDVFMAALRRRLLTSLPYNLYWFCYRREDIKTLPDFLIHPDVYFVIPSDLSGVTPPGIASDGVGPTSASLTEASAAKSTLSATAVLDVILNQTGKETPRLTRDPLAFFADNLRSTLPSDEVDSGADIYSLRSVLERVERAKRWEVDAIKAEKANDALLEQVREAVRGARYDDAHELAKKIAVGELTTPQLQELLSTLDSATGYMGDESPLTPSACDILISCVNELGKREATPTPRFLVNAANRQGNAFYKHSKFDEAIAAYDIAISRFDGCSDVATRSHLAMVHNNKGLALKVAGRIDEALKEHEHVINGLQAEDREDALNQVAVAMVFKGTLLTNAKRYSEAAEIFDASKGIAARIKSIDAYTKTVITNSEAAETAVRDAMRAAAGPSTTGVSATS